MKIAVVTGGREWNNPDAVRRALEVNGPGIDLILHGDCRGLDMQAGDIAQDMGFLVAQMPARWDEYGSAAGNVRNRWMLDCNPELVLAFHTDVANSRGTKDCINQAVSRDIPVLLMDGATTRRVEEPV